MLRVHRPADTPAEARAKTAAGDNMKTLPDGVLNRDMIEGMDSIAAALEMPPPSRLRRAFDLFHRAKAAKPEHPEQQRPELGSVDRR